jgi:hypothetical protein
MVRDWSAIERVMAWRIHQVAYVENLKPAVVELLDRAHQTRVAFLDQVEEGQAATGVAAGHGHDQTEVGSDEDVLGTLPFGDQGLKLGAGGVRLGLLLALKDLAREHARFDGLRKLDFLGGVEQRCARDFVEIHADQVAVGDLAAMGANTARHAGGLAGGGLTTGDGTGCHACSLANGGPPRPFGTGGGSAGVRPMLWHSSCDSSRVPCI